MDAFDLILIVSGAVIMVINIYSYVSFMSKMQDVVSSGRKIDIIWLVIGFSLLVFFLVGYLLVAFTYNPDVMTSFILFFGSVFVTIVLHIMARLIETAKERSIKIAEMLIGIIDARDPNLNGHSRHVSDLTMLFYNYLPRNIKRSINPLSLEYAALMHDLGKLGVPENILNKPAKLTDEEWELMRKHPEIGIKLLKPLKSFDSISDWILYHHERSDGNGYYRRTSDNTPIASKIIAICDTYSAITMRRSYKTPRTHEEAVEIIKNVAGTQLDKDLAEIFLTIPKDELEKCIPEQVKY